MQDLSFYEELEKWDFCAKISPMLNSGAMFFDPKTRLLTMTTVINPDTQWIYVRDNSEEQMRCRLWLQIWHQFFKIIPAHCMQCYKVVVKLDTVEDLFKMQEIQERMGRRAKCGYETREYVEGLYSGYFYCRGLEEGKQVHEKVCHWLDTFADFTTPCVSKKPLGESATAILKRACTEMERDHGPSSKWVLSDDDRKWYRIVMESTDPLMTLEASQPSVVKNHVKMRWLKFASQHKDKTARIFNNNKPLHVVVETYHDQED